MVDSKRPFHKVPVRETRDTGQLLKLTHGWYGADMITFAGRTYSENTACIVCSHVMGGVPIKLIVLDGDGDLQFLCGSNRHDVGDARIVGLDEIGIDRQGLDSLPDMAPETQAYRTTSAADWSVRPFTYDPDSIRSTSLGTLTR